MSVDPWGGGSDNDPKLRLKEIERMQRSLPTGKPVPWLVIAFGVGMTCCAALIIAALI